MAIIIKPQVNIAALNKLDDALKSIKKSVTALNKALEQTAKLSEKVAVTMNQMGGRPGTNTRGGNASTGRNSSPYFKQYGQPIGPRLPSPKQYNAQIGPQQTYLKQYNAPIGPNQQTYFKHYNAPIGPQQTYFKQYGQPIGPRLPSPKQYSAPIGPKQTYFKQYDAPIGPNQQAPFDFKKAGINALMTSRFGANGLMPLVGQVVKMLPPEFRLIAAEAIAAIELAKKALEVQTEYQQLYASGGGTASQAMAVGNVNAALGQDISGVGRNLSSGFGPLVAAKAGVNPMGGPFGDMDYNKKTLKVLELIAKQTSFTEARRIAEMTGTPELANFALLSKVTQNQLIAQGASGENDTGMRAWADLKAQISIGWNSLMKQVLVVATPFIQIADIVLKLSNGLTSVIEIINPVTHAFKFLASALDQVNRFFDWLAGLFGNKNDEHKDAINENTNAINNLNKSINQGIYGGGARAQNAIPRAQRTPGYYGANPMTPLGIL